jgi:hypothetical protein
MDNRKIASQLLVMAKEVLGMDFPTQDAMDKYMKDHPDADRSNHKVVETKKDEPAKKDEGKKDAPKKEDVSAGGKTWAWGDIAWKRSEIWDAMDKELQNSGIDRSKVEDAWQDFGETLDEVKKLGKMAEDGDERFRPLAKKLNSKIEALSDAIKKQKGKKDEDKPSSGEGFIYKPKPHKKVVPTAKSVAKVKKVLEDHNLTDESDELQEMAGFKRTLGQRVPESKKGQFYVRNEAKLKKDFIANMSPDNYDSQDAFKAAKKRMQDMPVSDFGKILAAISDEDTED